MRVTEPTLLILFLCLAFVLAPNMTKRFFLKSSKAYARAHALALLLVLLGLLLERPLLALSWPVFCGLGLWLFLRQEGARIFSQQGFASAIPFVFSLISALWFFAGVNDLGLLGYGHTWSLYAALHGSYLGWLFVGCLVQLAKQGEGDRRFHLSSYLCFLLFLLVAFGINGVPYVKRVGVVGLALLVPACIGAFAFSRRSRERRARALALTSFATITLAMALALLNEYWTEAPRVLGELPVMVIVHGALNALVTIPCFYGAILLDQRNRLDTLRRID